MLCRDDIAALHALVPFDFPNNRKLVATTITKHFFIFPLSLLTNIPLRNRLRDDEVVQLHAGDVTLMTPEQVEDGFVDENGFRMGTMTWIG